MKCNNCSKELPEGSQFCPYCLEKFTPETVMEPYIPSGKNRKHTLIISVAVSVLIITLLCLAFFIQAGRKSASGTEAAENESRGKFVEGEYYVTDENGVTSYPPATYVVVVDEEGNVKDGYILPD